MVTRSRMVQLMWFLVAAVLLAAAGMLTASLDRHLEEHELVPPGNVVAERHPELALLTIAPGGLRAPVLSYLWIRSQDLHRKGRHFDAMQLAELICNLQPRFAGVWSFHAWNMAWNISVATHTPQERWGWVFGGIRLLRDKAIPLNPMSLGLYRELGWIFFQKMGQTTDEMHMVYKQRWAVQMQRLLATPPYGTTQEAIEAFGPIARALLDKDPRRQGRDVIQPDQREILLRNEAVSRYAGLLAAAGVQIGWDLLDAYNRYSLDEGVKAVRQAPPHLGTDRDRELSAIINSTENAEARGKLLSFVRAQILWNVYKMDPQWMYELMVRYGPLDWREVQPHGLYWVTYGIHVCNSLELADIDSLNTDRVVLNSLKHLTWNGRLTYLENTREADSPRLDFLADRRFIDTTQQEYLRLIEAVRKPMGDEFKDNIFKTGHINYLINAIQMLYAHYERDRAREYFEWIKKEYDNHGGQWDMELEDFVVETLNRDGRPIPGVARNQLTSSLQVAFVFLARNNRQAYHSNLRYAMRVYDVYQKGVAERLQLPPFEIVSGNVLQALLVRPQLAGVYLPLLDRVRLYAALDARMRVILYDPVAPFLQAQCRAEELDFQKAFPAPPGLEEYRARQRRRLVPAQP